MTLHVLSVAYPFAPVSRDAAGGAEQILAALDAHLVASGHRSTVIAQAGSRVAGRLVGIEVPSKEVDDFLRARVHERWRSAIAETLSREHVDLMHLHGHDFGAYLPGAGVPVLATLHLPISWYPADTLRPARPNTWFNTVSRQQQSAVPPGVPIVGSIENGVPVERFACRHAKRGYALVLARICEEKGIALAIDAAERAGVPLLIGGALFPYAEHRRYFEERIRPRLGPRCRFLGPLGFDRKRRLLAGARCLLLPAVADETSSLVAREAAACGTPVIAFGRGALPETVEHGRTGFIVRTVEEMAAAIPRTDGIDADVCRSVAAARFDEARMGRDYARLYARLLAATGRGAA
jgi:glycosyltransferase involved in cell wall biosynthesis